MSLKSMLSGTSDLDKEFQSILKKALPAKEQFKTFSGNPPFATVEPLIPYILKNPAEASPVGTAFDYLARVMIARVINKNKISAYTDLKAARGLQRIEKQIMAEDKKGYNKLQRKYIDTLAGFIDYIYSDGSPFIHDPSELSSEEFSAAFQYLEKSIHSLYKPITEIESLISGAYYFAKLEQVFRSGGRIPDGGINALIAEPQAHIEQDLVNLCHVFKKYFLETGLVTRDSTVVFNPSFGLFSRLCKGADADIYIDGTLYDFKTSKNNGYDWKEIAQIVMYYYLNEFAYSWDKHVQESPNKDRIKKEVLPAQLKEYVIHNIAIYRARYGEIELCPTEILSQDTAKKICEHLCEKRIPSLFL